ncbi:MAG: hypothetical protein LIP01_03375 [Tannerellaceae bacterium]|nr:hypothetical protein [Tannerellaceae bacterium]
MKTPITTYTGPLKALLAGFFLIYSLALHGQTQTKQWQTSLPDTYVYKLSKKEVEEMFMFPERTQDIVKKILEKPYYTTFREKWEETPETGHYILFNIRNNRMEHRYQSFIPYQVILIPAYNSFTVQVVDATGAPTRRATLMLIDKDTKQKHTLLYDSQSKSYTIPLKKSEDFFLITELDGVRAYFDGDTQQAYKDWEDDDDALIKTPPRIYSYLVTDKSTYKPDDTIRLKSYILSGPGRPFKKKAHLQVGERNTFKEIQTPSPHRPGSFTGEFKADAGLLNLTLDKTYDIRLVDERGVILATTRFKYEDYQLFDYNLQVEVTHADHFYPDTNTVRIHATDVNNLPLLDMPINVTVLRKRMINIHGDDHHYSLPDTILHRQLITGKGASTIPLPGELFGKADLTYQVRVEVTMPDYRQMTQVKDIHYHYRHKELKQSVRDSVFVFEYRERGKSEPATATIQYNHEETTYPIELPHTEPFNPDIYRYEITTGKLPEPVRYTTASMIDLQVEADITDGFFHAELYNPLGIETVWYIYSGEELVKKGAGQTIGYRTRVRDTEDNWYVDVFYRLDNEMEQIREEVTPLNKKLRISTDLPERIYPGQEVESTITIKDFKGKPVKNVDITAFAVNGLLNEEFAPLPYYGEIFGDRREKDTYQLNAMANKKTTKLSFDTWKKIAALDTLPFYRFLYPTEDEWVYPYRRDNRRHYAVCSLCYFKR